MISVSPGGRFLLRIGQKQRVAANMVKFDSGKGDTESDRFVGLWNRPQPCNCIYNWQSSFSGKICHLFISNCKICTLRWVGGKLNTWLLSSTQENSFRTPERKVRRSNTYSETEQGSMATQEMSMDDSPSYGSFTTLMKEGSSEEHMKVTPVRRSNRLRNQKKSPLSAVQMISKWRSCIMFFLRATWFEHREKHEWHKEFFLQMTFAFTWLFLSKS